ncbi:MAG TPA: hypothetical protein EYP30_08880 [Archaeoglobaceae archaeon]|nr:hypothetical protein [Archaeoglobaceae archaeon]
MEPPFKDILERALKKAHREIYLKNKEFSERKGMGTTLVACLLDERGKGVIANVGDSRAYLIGHIP